MDVGIMQIIIHEARHGKDHNHCHLAGRSDGIPEGGSIMWITTHAPQHGRGPTLRDYSTISTGRASVPTSCSKATSGSCTHRYFNVVSVQHSKMNVNTYQIGRSKMLTTCCLATHESVVQQVLRTSVYKQVKRVLLLGQWLFSVTGSFRILQFLPPSFSFTAIDFTGPSSPLVTSSALSIFIFTLQI